MRVANHRPQSARHAGAHPGRADVDHHRHFESVDGFPERIKSALVDGEMAHDRMKMKTEKFELLDRLSGVLDRALAFERIDRAPGLTNHGGMTVAHLRNILIGTR